MTELENHVSHTVTDTDHPAPPPTEQLIPLSHLALDLPAPGEGWVVFLHNRNVPVVVDDLGRSAIARGAARRLFAEHRENEARKAEIWAAAERLRLRLISSFGLRWVAVCRQA